MQALCKCTKEATFQCFNCNKFFCDVHFNLVHEILEEHSFVALSGITEEDILPIMEDSVPLKEKDREMTLKNESKLSEKCFVKLEVEEESKTQFPEENKTELVSISTEQHLIGINRKNFHRMLDKAEEKGSQTKCVVVAFAGSTHAGKSTLIKTLMDRAGKQNDSILPGIGRDGVLDPTSGNINVFEMQSKKIYPGGGFVRLLDLEGEDGGDSLPMELSESLQVPQTFATPKEKARFMEGRRKIVRTHFPRVAYLTSNVIVYVTEQDLSVHSTYTRVLDFASWCSRDIEHSTSPALIIVQNRCHPDEIPTKCNDDEVTKFWLEAHDAGQVLSSKYQKIKCIFIPSYKWSKDAFDRQMTEFEGTLRKMIDNQLAFHTQQQIYQQTDENWLRFLHHTVTLLRIWDFQKDHSFVFSDLSDRHKNLNGLAQRAWLFFLTFRPLILSKDFIKRKNYFEELSKLSVELLINLIITTCNNSKEMIQAARGLDPGETIKKTTKSQDQDDVIYVYDNVWIKGKTSLQNQLVPELTKHAPCAANIQVGNTSFPCIRTVAEHHQGTKDGRSRQVHSTGQVPVTKKDNENLFIQLLKEIQGHFNVTTTHYWEGFPVIDWQKSLRIYFRQSDQIFYQKQKMSKDELINDRIAIIHQSWSLSKPDVSGCNHCLMCYDSNIKLNFLDCCRHKFCSDCIDSFEMSMERQNLPKCCPVCETFYGNSVDDLLESIQEKKKKIEIAREKALSKQPHFVDSEVQVSFSLSAAIIKLTPDNLDFNNMVPIGRGTYTRIFLIRNEDQHKCLKQFHIIDEADKQAFCRTAAIMSSCVSPFVVKFIGIIMNYERPSILMEYCSGGSLKSYLSKHKKLKDFAFFAKSVASTLLDIHNQGIVHGSLQLSKVLIDQNGNYKLGGFGSGENDMMSIERDIIDYGVLLYQAWCCELTLTSNLTVSMMEKKDLPASIIQIISVCLPAKVDTKELYKMTENLTKDL